MNPNQNPPQPPQMPQPPYAPAPQPPHRRSSAVILGIVLGVVLIGTIIALAVILASRGDDKPSTDRDTSSTKRETTTYENARVSFAYPDFLKQKDTSNTTRLNSDGTSPSDTQVFLNDNAMVSYFMIGGANTKQLNKATRLDAMKQGVEAQLSATEAQAIRMRASSGYGCTEKFQYTSQPILVEKDEIVGMKYGYACTSHYGDVQGEYFVWFDIYGAKHSLIVDAKVDYWKSHHADLEAVTRSVALLTTGNEPDCSATNYRCQ